MGSLLVLAKRTQMQLDENGGGPGVRLRKRQRLKKPR